MILEEKRDQVIENIQRATARGEFNVCVEPDDPTPSADERKELREGFLRRFPTMRFRACNYAARAIAGTVTALVNRKTPVYGIEKVAGIQGGAIVTSNHFSPVDNTVVRTFLRQVGKRYMPVVGSEVNLAMPGLFGFLMNYADIIPISTNPDYMKHDFESLLGNRLSAGEYVLMYPEQEMWFNYRKPRPCKRGTYYYAALFNVPIISCFVEIRDLDELEAPNFMEVSYDMHVLDPIYPNPEKTVRENSVIMCERDYKQKVAAYEAAYGKKLDYRFSVDDIAGWVPPVTAVDKVRAMYSGDLCKSV